MKFRYSFFFMLMGKTDVLMCHTSPSNFMHSTASLFYLTSARPLTHSLRLTSFSSSILSFEYFFPPVLLYSTFHFGFLQFLYKIIISLLNKYIYASFILCCLLLAVARFWLDQWRGPAAPGPVWHKPHIRKRIVLASFSSCLHGHLSCCIGPVNQR